MKTLGRKSSKDLEGYLQLSRSIVSKPIPHADKAIGISMTLALFGALQTVDAQVIYSGTQNVACNLAAASNRCYANIDLAGGNDFEIHRNVVGAMNFIQVDEVPGGGFDINGFDGPTVGGYVYPYALNLGAVIGPASPWGFNAGQGNSLSDNGFYPNHKWESLPNGTTRFLGIRGTVGGNTKYGWIRLTKNGFGNYTIVDWAYNNNTGQPIAAGAAIPTAAAVSISGRVMTSPGRGLRGAIVTATDSNGQILTATTSTFGYYRFENITAGQTLVLAVQSRRYQFDPQVLSIEDNLEGIDFFAH